MRNQRIKKICPVCKNSFNARNYPNRKQKYCSKECWSKRNPKKLISCLFCGKEILTYERSKIYCSNECRNEHYKLRFKGENSHFWKGGKTKKNKLLRTSANFKAWRQLVFERDDYTCQKCGKRSCAGGRIEIHPHHIKHLSEYPELAYDINNGKTLCRDCHFALHREKLTNKQATKLTKPYNDED